ncbi:hypothetical protein DID77_02545 [Candidatus Marinamargulisbacteria bacterium SCGC AG-439-L15]|nr:hypothetical protein DID77_02545 [Candidatus Marinamargulisbacteria bacterium SCGC AG-439-L15]
MRFNLIDRKDKFIYSHKKGNKFQEKEGYLNMKKRSIDYEICVQPCLSYKVVAANTGSYCRAGSLSKTAGKQKSGEEKACLLRETAEEALTKQSDSSIKEELTTIAGEFNNVLAEYALDKVPLLPQGKNAQATTEIKQQLGSINKDKKKYPDFPFRTAERNKDLPWNVFVRLLVNASAGYPINFQEVAGKYTKIPKELAAKILKKLNKIEVNAQVWKKIIKTGSDLLPEWKTGTSIIKHIENAIETEEKKYLEAYASQYNSTHELFAQEGDKTRVSLKDLFFDSTKQPLLSEVINNVILLNLIKNTIGTKALHSVLTALCIEGPLMKKFLDDYEVCCPGCASDGLNAINKFISLRFLPELYKGQAKKLKTHESNKKKVSKENNKGDATFWLEVLTEEKSHITNAPQQEWISKVIAETEKRVQAFNLEKGKK